jgi:hypothetical protein
VYPDCGILQEENTVSFMPADMGRGGAGKCKLPMLAHLSERPAFHTWLSTKNATTRAQTSHLNARKRLAAGVLPQTPSLGIISPIHPFLFEGKVAYRGHGSESGKGKGRVWKIVEPGSYNLTNRTLTSGLELGTSAALAKMSAVTQLTEFSAFVVLFPTGNCLQ